MPTLIILSCFPVTIQQSLKHVKDNYSFEQLTNGWVETMDKFVEENGSWETRKNYQRWHLMEVA